VITKLVVPNTAVFGETSYPLTAVTYSQGPPGAQALLFCCSGRKSSPLLVSWPPPTRYVITGCGSAGASSPPPLRAAPAGKARK
jgi:hypothetical protein